MNIQRIPRPAGLSQASKYLNTLKGEYYKRELDNIKNRVIRNYIHNGYTLNGLSLSLEDLGEWLGIGGNELLLRIQRQVKSMGLLVKEEREGDLYRAFLAMALRNVLADSQEANAQTLILKGSQGLEYQPFISREVNGAIKLRLDATKNLMEMVKLLQANGAPLEKDPIDKMKEQYLTPLEAINIMRGENGQPSALEPSTLAGLKASYNPEEWPEVNAREQENAAPSERAVTSLYKKKKVDEHEEKREVHGEFEEVQIIGD